VEITFVELIEADSRRRRRRENLEQSSLLCERCRSKLLIDNSDKSRRDLRAETVHVMDVGNVLLVANARIINLMLKDTRRVRPILPVRLFTASFPKLSPSPPPSPASCLAGRTAAADYWIFL